MSAPKKKPLQPRKQPSQTRSADTVSVILEAAAHILDDAGYGQYSTNAIARRAGVSIGSLYQYFPNKDAITIALIRQHHAHVVDALRQCALLDDWHEAVRAMIDAAARQQMSRPALARILDVEEARLHPERGAGDIIDIVEATLLRGPTATRGIDHRTLARDLVAITRGVTDATDATDATADQQDDVLARLRHRLDCAVFGYLSRACPADGIPDPFVTA